MTDDTLIDPVEVQNDRPDRDHLFKDLSIHDRILKLNHIAGNKPTPPARDDYWKRLQSRKAAIEDELTRVTKAIDQGDRHALRESLCKAEVALHNLAYVGNLPLERDMVEVTDALLTQFCTSDFDVEATVDHYREQGIETYLTKDEESGYTIVRSSKFQGDASGKAYRKGALLKSVFYRKPEFNTPFK
jgi:hypothetical protein